MSKAQKIILIISVVVGLAAITGAVVVTKKRNDSNKPAAQHAVSQAELKKADGKNGHDCLVAIDGTVYLIKDFSLWQNGKHTPSKGLAYCGADLSKAIDKAPHGRKILDLLPKVGWLTK
ncbi:MAG TPA: hypothetical protein VLH38_05635 [Patescibacteria group bacterium]|nr:hypothetical protein [Patescibacteria group bacterium]